jgi:hypothetical protein
VSTESNDAIARGGVTGFNPALQAWADQPSRFIAPPATLDGPVLREAVLSISPMWLYPPPGATRFFLDERNVTVAAGAVDFDLPGLELRLNQGLRGVLSSYRLVVNSPVVNSGLYFTIKLNGAPIPGLDRLTVPAVAAVAALYEDTPYFQFPQNGRLTVTVTNPDAVAFNVNAALSGWSYSAVEGDKLTGNSKYAG